MTAVEFELSELGFADKDALKARLARLDALEAKDREREVADRCKNWQDEGKSPALVAEARTIMMSDKGNTVINLSEDGKNVGLTATDIVERLITKSASVNLTQDPVTDKDTSTDRPGDNDATELSQEEKRLATSLWLDDGLSEAEAKTEAKRRLKSDNS